jgi:hypothetical protein
MFPRLIVCLALAVPLAAQDAAADLKLTEVVLAARMANAASLGTVSSIAAAADGTVYVLQRGDQADPVIALNTEGRVLRSWGKGMYVSPHSIRIDPQGNIWTVDAGNSKLIKFTPQGEKLQEIQVPDIATGSGCAFPGLCGTTDVAFGPNGRLFISDGYGNARIIEYTAAGQMVKAWGRAGAGPGEFQIPHGIATDGNTIWVADRTNARIQRFSLDGTYQGEWKHLGRPYALKVSGGALWLAGMTLATPASPVMLKVDPRTGELLGQTPSPGPHTIDVNAAGELFATGCCGGTNATSFSWLRK